MIKRYFQAVLGGERQARFYPYTSISSDASQVTEQANLYGIPGATLTIEVVTYTNTNGTGTLKVDAVQVFLSTTFNIVLDGDGRGTFDAQCAGDSGDTGTIVLGKFQITATDMGTISSIHDDYQISKVF